jgi:polar amino acid transport system substrate-binding protein
MNWRTIFILFLLILTTIVGYLYMLRRPVTQFVTQETNNILKVGTNAEYPPFSFIENDQIVGFDIDIIKEIATRLNKKIEIKNMSFAALLPELQLGTIQVIAAGVTPSEEKKKRVLFTSLYFGGDPLMAVQPKDRPQIATGEDLKGKRVSVNQGYTADQYLSGLEGLHVMRLSSPLITTGIMTLKSNQADVYVASKTALAPYFAKQSEQPYQITPLEGTEETYAFAVSKKYPGLYKSIEQELTKMIQDGTIETFKKKWGLA